jgi:hypothetical protein
MSEELGKIEKPSVEQFKEGRKLYFAPIIYQGESSPEEYLAKFKNYWQQVTEQIAELESKLGKIHRIYHELVYAAGEEGLKAIKELNAETHKITERCIGSGACLETIEEGDILMEFMDWNRCLLIGLQSHNALNQVYNSYVEANKKRNEYISAKIDETLDTDEIGLLLMRESHQVQFPADIQVIYITPPALDDIKRWVRDNETAPDSTE